jgi:hypothetical protein
MANLILIFLALILIVAGILDMYYNCMVHNKENPNDHVEWYRWTVSVGLWAVAIVLFIYAF